MKVELKTITPNAEINIVEIARVSSGRLDKTEAPEGLINYLIKINSCPCFPSIRKNSILPNALNC